MPLTGTFVERKKTRVGCRTIQLFLRDAPKQLNRVVVALLPQHRVEPPETERANCGPNSKPGCSQSRADVRVGKVEPGEPGTLSAVESDTALKY